MSHESAGRGSIDMPMPMTPGSSMPSMDMGMAMHMTFFWGKHVVMLFKDWPNGKLGMYILALAIVFLLAAAVEFLSVFPVVKQGTRPAIGSLAHASVYALRMALVYLVMLSVMSYNLGVFIVAVSGHAFGFLFVKYKALSLASKAQADPNTIPKV